MLGYGIKRIKRIAMASRDIDQELVDASEEGNKDKVFELLARGADARCQESAALRHAATNGHEECVRLLLPASDPKAAESEALRRAARNGHAECVRLLLPVSAPKAEESEALRWAVENGHEECVRLLLPASDPKAAESEALRRAAWNGHEECVRLLLPMSDAKANGSEALRGAAGNGHAECVKLLAALGSRHELKKALEEAMDEGESKIAALLIEQEPGCVDGVDLSKCLAAAHKKGHADLAAFLSSIIEQRELGVAANRAHSSLRPARI